MRCVACEGDCTVDGQACPACGGRGVFEVAGCPWVQDSIEIRQALFAEKQAGLGRWPVEGGWLEQTQVCLDAVEMITAERNEWRAHEQAD